MPKRKEHDSLSQQASDEKQIFIDRHKEKIAAAVDTVWNSEEFQALVPFIHDYEISSKRILRAELIAGAAIIPLLLAAAASGKLTGEHSPETVILNLAWIASIAAFIIISLYKDIGYHSEEPELIIEKLSNFGIHYNLDLLSKHDFIAEVSKSIYNHQVDDAIRQNEVLRTLLEDGTAYIDGEGEIVLPPTVEESKAQRQ